MNKDNILTTLPQYLVKKKKGQPMANLINDIRCLTTPNLTQGIYKPKDNQQWRALQSYREGKGGQEMLMLSVVCVCVRVRAQACVRASVGVHGGRRVCIFIKRPNRFFCLNTRTMLNTL